MITRRRKQLYLAVTLIGALALAVDRLVLTGGPATPQQAAAEPSPAADTPTAEEGAPADAPVLSIPELPFPKKLQPPYNPDRPIRDLFQPPEVIRFSEDDHEPDKDDPSGADGKRPDRMSAAVFASEHRLNGVVVQERLRIAIVDGVWMQIGQSVSGCTLTAIAGNSVEFSCSDGPVALKVNAADGLLRH